MGKRLIVVVRRAGTWPSSAGIVMRTGKVEQAIEEVNDGFCREDLEQVGSGAQD